MVWIPKQFMAAMASAKGMGKFAALGGKGKKAGAKPSQGGKGVMQKQGKGAAKNGGLKNVGASPTKKGMMQRSGQGGVQKAVMQKVAQGTVKKGLTKIPQGSSKPVQKLGQGVGKNTQKFGQGKFGQGVMNKSLMQKSSVKTGVIQKFGKGGLKKQFTKMPVKSSPQRDEAGGQLGRFVGKIETIGAKFGFIMCSKLKQQGYEKVFVLGDQLHGFQADATVNFTAYLDSQGRCQGKDLKLGSNMSNTSVVKPGQGAKTVTNRDEAGGQLGECIGKIESIGAKFGFIACSSLQAKGFPNVFVLADQLKGFNENQKVSFTAYMDSQGRCQGKNLKVPMQGKQAHVAKVPMHGKQPHVAKVAKVSDLDEAGGALGDYVGTIQNVGAKFGFIACPALKQQGFPNVFVLSNQLQGLQANQKVKFSAYLDSQARCQGKNLKARN